MLRKKYIILFIVAIALTIMMIGYAYDIHGGDEPGRNFFPRLLVNLPFATMLAFIDGCIVVGVRKWLRRRGDVLRVAVSIALATLANSAITGTMNFALSDSFDFQRDSLSVVPWSWIMVLLIEVFFAHLREEEMKREKAQYQFRLLKNQMNPHFLFNSLNVLASLAYEDADKTNAFAKRLSSVYRYLLGTYERTSVSLGEEMDFVRSYIYLENVRFDNTLRVAFDIAPAAERRRVVPASIQMLVENAVKHNVNTKAEPLTITIHAGDDGIVVTNNFRPRNNVATNGVGLQNLEKQYALRGKKIIAARHADTFTVALPYLDA